MGLKAAHMARVHAALLEQGIAKDDAPSMEELEKLQPSSALLRGCSMKGVTEIMQLLDWPAFRIVHERLQAAGELMAWFLLSLAWTAGCIFGFSAKSGYDVNGAVPGEGTCAATSGTPVCVGNTGNHGDARNAGQLMLLLVLILASTATAAFFALMVYNVYKALGAQVYVGKTRVLASKGCVCRWLLNFHRCGDPEVAHFCCPPIMGSRPVAA